MLLGNVKIRKFRLYGIITTIDVIIIYVTTKHKYMLYILSNIF